ncbi:hypothetical protein GOEFS_132_00520 [Gordonia effusa NBRC 100432]|uniref:Uncharacterized protein n=1 Tax=Gordonia effusa NBRC 100432 TaxID=1077974 RepID=H0R6X0_9ACTN|nr:DUF1295 domain-containing protein [Gordonia effusa]GAB20821.1 hypothetical protein GOEFS_132_00520 [Gordonia effusa NBRC 100432]
MSDFFYVAALSAAVLALVQAVTYLVGRRIGRYNVVDVAWGVGLVAVALVALVAGDGDLTRRILLAAIVSVWGLRLSWHMWLKSAGAGEDPRYVALLERHGGARPVTVITRIFLTQALAQWVISLPVQVAAVSGPVSGVSWLLVAIGTALSVTGFVVEATGDWQLRRFKSDPRNRGVVMDRGLWAWTRHPNYFGDACVWWGIYGISAATWPGVLMIVSPVLMTYFLVVGTGARLLEQHMADRPGFAEYQRRTSFFIPWPPKV